MIICDLGSGIGHAREQGGFPYVGESDQAHVGDCLQFQHYLQFYRRLAGLRIFGDLHGGGGKIHIAKAASSAF